MSTETAILQTPAQDTTEDTISKNGKDALEKKTEPSKGGYDPLYVFGHFISMGALFNDQYGEPYIKIYENISFCKICNKKESLLCKKLCQRKNEITEVSETLPLKSQKISNRIRLFIKNTFSIIPSKNEVNEIKDMIQAHIQENKPTYNLELRVSKDKNYFYIDMTNRAGEAIAISSNGWFIIREPPILFRRHNDMLPIPRPSPTGTGNAKLLLKYVNMPKDNKNAEIMFLTSVATIWIPKIKTLGNNIWGVEGGQKTSTMRYIKKVFDPNIKDVIRMPKDIDEFRRQLHDNYLICYDNISHLTQEHSDEICSAITGVATDKRKLYTDNDTITRVYQNRFMMNGIVQAAIYPDLAQRLNSTEVTPVEKLRKETDMNTEFERDLPYIISGFLDTIREAIKIYPTLNDKVYLHRMADFSQWGCAIAIALGYTKEEFETALKNKDNEQLADSLNNSPLASAVMEFCDKPNNWLNYDDVTVKTSNGNDYLEMKPVTFLKILTITANNMGIDTKSKYWAKSPDSLSRQMKRIENSLKKSGYDIQFGKSHDRYVRISPKDKKVNFKERYKRVEKVVRTTNYVRDSWGWECHECGKVTDLTHREYLRDGSIIAICQRCAEHIDEAITK